MDEVSEVDEKRTKAAEQLEIKNGRVINAKKDAEDKAETAEPKNQAVMDALEKLVVSMGNVYGWRSREEALKTVKVEATQAKEGRKKRWRGLGS